MKYRHTQTGYLIIFAIFATIVLFGVILIQGNFNIFILSCMFFILIVLTSFISLQVMINNDYLQIKFTYGIYKKRFLLKEIVSAQAVKNHWYYGWGIRLGMWPYMWIFNVSGFDAVEIKMKNGKIYRIGTDEPKTLEAAIIESIK